MTRNACGDRRVAVQDQTSRRSGQPRSYPFDVAPIVCCVRCSSPIQCATVHCRVSDRNACGLSSVAYRSSIRQVTRTTWLLVDRRYVHHALHLRRVAATGRLCQVSARDACGISCVAYCSKALWVGAHMTTVTRVCLFIFAPIAWPMGKVSYATHETPRALRVHRYSTTSLTKSTRVWTKSAL